MNDYVFDPVQLPSFTISANDADLSDLLPKVTPKWEMIIPDKSGNPSFRVVITEFAMRRSLAGQKAYADWYKLDDFNQWEYVGRYPVTWQVRK